MTFSHRGNHVRSYCRHNVYVSQTSRVCIRVTHRGDITFFARRGEAACNNESAIHVTAEFTSVDRKLEIAWIRRRGKPSRALSLSEAYAGARRKLEVDANAYANNTTRRLQNWHLSRRAARPDTEWDADDVRIYTDTRVIMGLLKMMHRRNNNSPL